MPTTPDAHPILVVGQTIEINDVVSILVSVPVLDSDGDWVRQVQFYRQQDPGVSNPAPVLTVVVKGTQIANINIAAPGSEF